MTEIERLRAELAEDKAEIAELASIAEDNIKLRAELAARPSAESWRVALARIESLEDEIAAERACHDCREYREMLEMKLATANERAEKLRGLLDEVAGVGADKQPCWCYAGQGNVEHDATCRMVREALRSTPAVRADSSIPKDEVHFINRDGSLAGKISNLAPAQEPKPLPHAFRQHSKIKYAQICGECGLLKSAHQPPEEGR